MPPYLKFAAAALAAILPFSSAQTYTDCDPLQKTCPPNKGLSRSSFDSDFTKGNSALAEWEVTSGSISTGPNGAEFTVSKKGDAPTIQTPFYFFFGKAEVTMKIAPGTGIVSSIVLESDDLDEVDWEGLGGFNDQIETNYFGKGDTSSYDRATYPHVDTPVDTFHTYTIDWQKDHITWSVDGNVLRTLLASDAEGGTRFPQTPMNLRIGIWAGGDPDNGKGTIEWAGGLTDYSQGPFTMYIKSVHIENENPAESYTYGDHSGSWESIQFDGSGAVRDPPSSTTTTTTTKKAPTTTSATTVTSEPTTATTGSSSVSVTTTGSASKSFTTSTTSPSSSAGSGSGSSTETGSGSSPTTGSDSSPSSDSGPSASPSSTAPVNTGGASTLAGLPLAFVGLVAVLLQL